MTYYSHFPLQQGVYQILAGDATLMALVTGIYDHVPAGTDYPFVTIGEAAITDWSNAEKKGTEQRTSIRVYSRGSGRKEAATIMERIVTLLQDSSPTVTGQAISAFKFTGSNIMLEDDGTTYRGTLTFRILMNEA